MKVTRTELIENYADMSTEELLDHWESGTLTDLAIEVSRDELTRRGIDLPPLVPAADEADETETMLPVHEGHFETVARSFTPTEMHILRGRLQADGIPAFVVDDHINQANALLAVATGGARLQVEEQYLADALRIVNEVKAGACMLNDDANGVPDEAPTRKTQPASSNWEFLLSAIILVFALIEFADTLWMAHTFHADIVWDEVAAFAIALPILYLVGALMLVLRSKWALPCFVLHLSISVVTVLFLTSDNGLPTNQIVGWICTAGIIYFCFHLRRTGRLA